ncbi:MAG TPA: PQQ-binding-like beta-propeller repeat protein [Chloroflexaceae bacterium]|nr:PQQ-binding-like beta-propeller repeat protein [Chloroflexaceae bacterium]
MKQWSIGDREFSERVGAQHARYQELRRRSDEARMIEAAYGPRPTAARWVWGWLGAFTRRLLVGGEQRAMTGRARGFTLIVLLTLLLVPMAAGHPRTAGAVHDGNGGTIWVTNRDRNEVAVFAAADGTLLATIPVGGEPIGIISPLGSGRVYVTNEAGNSVSVIDMRRLEVVKTIPTGPRPHHMASSQNGHFVYFGEFGTNKVGVIDTRSDTLVAEYVAGPPTARTHAVAVSRDGKLLLATNDVANTLVALDAATGEQRWSLDLGSFPYEAAIDATGKVAYVSLRRANKVVAIDLESQRVYGESAVGTEPVTLQLSSNGKLLAVALRTSPAALGLMDTTTGAVERVALPGPAGHNWLSPGAHTSYVAVEGGNAGVAVVDHATKQVTVYPYPGGGRPHGVFFAPGAR